MFRNFLSVSFVSLAVVSLALVAGLAPGNTLTYNFDGSDSPGTWAPISPYPGDSVQTYQVTQAAPLLWAPAQSGAYVVVGMPWSNNYNVAGATFSFASPAFNLDGSGDLTFWLNVANASFTGVLSVPTAFASAFPANRATGGFLGAVLLDDSTGNVVLAGSADHTLDWRSSTSNSWTTATGIHSRLGDGWWQLRFSQTQLGALSQSDTYQLVLVSACMDYQGLDTVAIPGTLASSTPEPSTLALLAAGLIGLLCYAWRKRS